MFTALQEQLGQAISAMRDANRAQLLRASVKQRVSHYTYGPATEGLVRALRSVIPATG